jgi:AraC-like DNA-binding protein
MNDIQRIVNGRQKYGRVRHVPRHRHNQAYAAIVLSGAYEECGNRGRFRVGPGDVLLHGAFDAHLDRIRPQGAEILNLTISDYIPAFGMGRIDDPDALVRCAERDARQASRLLGDQLQPLQCVPEDWPDVLAHRLLTDPTCRLLDWARENGLAAETVSRGFRKVFGVTPAFFRAETRAHGAFRQIVGDDAPLACIAASSGFADQAHMSRAVKALTGESPGIWRRSNPFKTGAASRD